MPGTIGEQEINAIANGLKNLSIQQQATVLSTTTLTNAQKVAVLEANEFTNAEISSALAASGLSVATKELTLEEFKNIAAVKAGEVAKADELITTLGLEAAENGRLIGLENITREQFIAIAMQKGYTAAQAEALATSVGYTTANGALALSYKGLTTAIATTAKSIATTTTSFAATNPVLTGVIALVGLLTAGIIAYNKVNKELKEKELEEIEKSKERKNNLETELDVIESVTEEYSNLANKVDLTSDEKDRLKELQDKLNKSFDTESSKIDLVNGKYDEQIEKLRTLNKEKNEDYIREVKNLRLQSYGRTIDNKRNILTDEDTWKLGINNKDFYDEYYSAVIKAISNGEIKGVSATTVNNGTIPVRDFMISENMTSEEKVESLKQLSDILERVVDTEDRSDKSYLLFSGKIQSLIKHYEKEANDYQGYLNEEVGAIFDSFSYNGTTISNVTEGSEEAAQAWLTAMKDEFAKNDHELYMAINDYYIKNIKPAFEKSAEENTIVPKFNWSEFYNEQGLEDVKKKLKSLKTAYKSLEENGELNKDEQASLLNDYPELLQYIDDPNKLKVAIQSSAREAISAAQLVLTNLYLAAEAGSTEEANLKKALGVLDDMADVTTKVKEKTTKTSDLYKEQKKQIHENIQALNREIQSIDKQVDALEKKKEAQEEYVKQLEEEKDRLDDLIDKYERAADTVSDYIDEQIDGLEKQQDAIEKSYNDQIDALKEYYDEQSDLLSEQIKGLEFDSSSYDSQIDSIEKQIKAIQKQGDEQEKVNKLKEKELALEKAKEQMVRVYDATRGWVKKSLIL